VPERGMPRDDGPEAGRKHHKGDQQKQAQKAKKGKKGKKGTPGKKDKIVI
jgi:hypothetical protein